MASHTQTPTRTGNGFRCIPQKRGGGSAMFRSIVLSMSATLRPKSPPSMCMAKPYKGISGGDCGIELPSEDSVLPRAFCSSLAGRQPYRIILTGEKTSLGPVLRPLGGISELLLPTGEPTDTMIYGMAQRAVEDGRPAVVLYFSDFDPAGHQMPISVSRKLQALRTLEFPSLKVEVHSVALTIEQVIALDLP